MNAVDDNKVVIFDTTLRDGEQAPGCSMTLNEKLRVATALQDLKVDVIEAGFPAASPGDFDSVQTIARSIESVTICGLARCNSKDIKRAWDAVKDAASPRIHVFVATSEIHRERYLIRSEQDTNQPTAAKLPKLFTSRRAQLLVALTKRRSET